jgi:hypothetical protein
MARKSKPHSEQPSQDQAEHNGSNGAPTGQGPSAPGAFIWEYYPTPDELVRLSNTLDSLIENFERLRERAKLWGDDLSTHITSEAFCLSYRGFKEFCECLGLYGRRYDPQTMSHIINGRMPADLFLDMFRLAHTLSHRGVIGHFSPPGLVPLVTDPTLAMLHDVASRLHKLIKEVEPPAENETTPRWDKQDRALWYGDALCRRLREGTEVQKLIEAFDSKGWPSTIPNPFTSEGKLRDIIKSYKSGAKKQNRVWFYVDNQKAAWKANPAQLPKKP